MRFVWAAGVGGVGAGQRGVPHAHLPAERGRLRNEIYYADGSY